jgi:hypothetical protein
MDEYLYYLNAMKQQGYSGGYDNRRGGHSGGSGGKYYKDRQERDSRDRGGDRRPGGRSYKDYDAPKETTSTSTGGRQLISYDDL